MRRAASFSARACSYRVLAASRSAATAGPVARRIEQSTGPAPRRTPAKGASATGPARHDLDARLRLAPLCRRDHAQQRGQLRPRGREVLSARAHPVAEPHGLLLEGDDLDVVRAEG